MERKCALKKRNPTGILPSFLPSFRGSSLFPLEPVAPVHDRPFQESSVPTQESRYLPEKLPLFSSHFLFIPSRCSEPHLLQCIVGCCLSCEVKGSGQM